MATQVAHADVPVLITGPNGAGKEVLADIVQANSAVRAGPYLKVNLGALPQELIEAELFGTEAGAFTGARARVGRFEAADGGTLFLDELGNLAPAARRSCCACCRPGSSSASAPTTRAARTCAIIAATNTDLRAAIRDGRFREDLFYRLNVIELELPPLARRARGHPAAGAALSGSRLRARRRKPSGRWSALLLAGQRARAAERHPPRLPARRRRRPSAPRPGTLAAEQSACPEEPALDRASIEQALQRAHGVVAHAARDLGLSRQALYRRMERLGLKSD